MGVFTKKANNDRKNVIEQCVNRTVTDIITKEKEKARISFR